MYDNCLVLQRSFNDSMITIIIAQFILFVLFPQVTCLGFMNPIDIKWSDVVIRELFHLSHNSFCIQFLSPICVFHSSIES